MAVPALFAPRCSPLPKEVPRHTSNIGCVRWLLHAGTID